MAFEYNTPPRNPFFFTLKATLRSIPPLLRSGALSMTPAQLPSMLNSFLRWRFSIASILSMSTLRYPTRIALVDDRGELTYQELHDHARALAKAMLVRGLSSKKAFGVIARNGRGIITPMCMKALTGSEIMLMNTGISPSQISGLIQSNNIRFLFLDEEFLDQLPDDLHGCRIVITHLNDPQDRSHIPDYALIMDDLIQEGQNSSTSIPYKVPQGRIIIMSSGTTGLPKGILRHEPKSPATLGAIVDRIPWRKNMVIHQSASMFHAWGWANVMIALVTGATLITHRIFDPQLCLEQCKKYKVNGIISAAVWLQQLNEEMNRRKEINETLDGVGPFSFLVSSGNAIPGWLVQSLTQHCGPVIHNFYGSTEAGLSTIASGADLAAMPTTAGKPAIGVRFAILDDNGHELPRGVVGRIFTCQELTFYGYLSEQDNFRTYKGMYEIGDKGYMDHEGYVYIAGRSDDMLIRGGENVFPREVDECIGSLTGVQDCYTLGSKEDTLMPELHLYVVRASGTEGTNLTEEGIKETIASHLASWSIPDKVFFVPHLPRNANGKVVPRELSALGNPPQ